MKKRLLKNEFLNTSFAKGASIKMNLEEILLEVKNSYKHFIFFIIYKTNKPSLEK